jgi:hypothetical protein
MPLPAGLVFTELSGSEIKEILEQRFHSLLDAVPFLQRHLTLPRLSMTLTVHLDQWADQQTPERLTISDSVTLENRISAAPTPDGHPPDKVREDHGLEIPTPHYGDKKYGAHLNIFGQRPEYTGISSAKSDAAGSGGTASEAAVPGLFRTLTPASIPDPFEIAVRVFTPAGVIVPAVNLTPAPAPDILSARVVEEAPGVSIDRTGSGGLTSAGLAKMQGATVVNMDQGPAGLRQGGERASLGIFKNVGRS